MARTKASVGAKVSSGKSSKARCSVAPTPTASSSSGGERSSRNYSGGNPVCPRETPKWQKPITNFFITNQNQNKQNDDEAAGSSKSKPKRNVIYSDDESDSETNKENENMNKSKENESNANKSEENESNSNKSEENESNSNKSTEYESKTEAESQEYECSQTYENSPPKNRELDESIILEPLTGENSHKLEEYYSKDKGKGKGKKTKENNNNISNKRPPEDVETPNAKKIKVM